MKKVDLQNQIKDMQKYIYTLDDELIHGKPYTDCPFTFNRDVPFNPHGCYSYYVKYFGLKESINQNKGDLELLHSITTDFIDMTTKDIFPFAYINQIRFRKFQYDPYLSEDSSGKWMCFLSKKYYLLDYVSYICKEYMELNNLSSHSCKIIDGNDSYVICFYIDIQNYKDHISCLSYLLQNHLVPKTKSGKLYNISFKLDNQTRNGEYGISFIPKLTLSDFFDLNTGEIKTEVHFNQIIKGDDN